jgi:hypothetical protein
LNKYEQRAVLAATGASWNTEKIEDALKLMYNDAHMDDKRRMAEHRPKSGGWAGRRSHIGSYRPHHDRAKGVNFEEEVGHDGDWEDEDPQDMDEATENAGEEQLDPLEEEWGNESDVSDWSEEPDAEQLMDTYYQGLKAKKHLRR